MDQVTHVVPFSGGAHCISQLCFASRLHNKFFPHLLYIRGLFNSSRGEEYSVYLLSRTLVFKGRHLCYDENMDGDEIHGTTFESSHVTKPLEKNSFELDGTIKSSLESIIQSMSSRKAIVSVRTPIITKNKKWAITIEDVPIDIKKLIDEASDYFVKTQIQVQYLLHRCICIAQQNNIKSVLWTIPYLTRPIRNQNIISMLCTEKLQIISKLFQNVEEEKMYMLVRTNDSTMLPSLYDQYIDPKSILKHLGATATLGTLSQEYQSNVYVPTDSKVICICIPQWIKKSGIEIRRVIDDHGQANYSNNISVFMPVVSSKDHPAISRNTAAKVEPTHLFDILKDYCYPCKKVSVPSQIVCKFSHNLAQLWTDQIAKPHLNGNQMSNKDINTIQDIQESCILHDMSLIHNLIWICKNPLYQDTLWERCNTCMACCEWNLHK